MKLLILAVLGVVHGVDAFQCPLSNPYAYRPNYNGNRYDYCCATPFDYNDVAMGSRPNRGNTCQNGHAGYTPCPGGQPCSDHTFGADDDVNLLTGKTVTASDVYHGASWSLAGLVDGDNTFGFHSSGPSGSVGTWVQVDLGVDNGKPVRDITVLSRMGSCHSRLFGGTGCNWDSGVNSGTWDHANQGFFLGVSDTPCTGSTCPEADACGGKQTTANANGVYTVDCVGKTGRYVYLWLPSYGSARRMMNVWELVANQDVSYDSCLISQNWKTAEELAAMSYDDKRNTVISGLDQYASVTQTVSQLQTMSNADLNAMCTQHTATPTSSPTGTPTGTPTTAEAFEQERIDLAFDMSPWSTGQGIGGDSDTVYICSDICFKNEAGDRGEWSYAGVEADQTVDLGNNAEFITSDGRFDLHPTDGITFTDSATSGVKVYPWDCDCVN